MEKKITSLKVNNMVCTSCEAIIREELQELPGVEEVNASYLKGIVEVTFDADLVSVQKIKQTIIEAGYTPKDIKGNETDQQSKKSNRKITQRKYTIIVLVSIFIIALYTFLRDRGLFSIIPEMEGQLGYFTLFTIGLITSLHCISMCGGINLSVCVGIQSNSTSTSKWKILIPSFQYNAGRVVAYTLIGGIVGGIGSAVHFQGNARGLIAIIAGILMIIMGINMTGAISFLRKVMIRMPKFIRVRLMKRRNKTPFVVGLINGMMPCGPLQAMQIYALGTGNVVEGALSMFFFSIGTVPLMFSLGAFARILKKRHTDMIMKIGAILVILLGISMLGTGLALSGINISFWR